MVNPPLNINDPNNKTTDLGGALIVDLESGLPGMSVISVGAILNGTHNDCLARVPEPDFSEAPAPTASTRRPLSLDITLTQPSSPRLIQ